MKNLAFIATTIVVLTTCIARAEVEAIIVPLYTAGNSPMSETNSFGEYTVPAGKVFQIEHFGRTNPGTIWVTNGTLNVGLNLPLGGTQEGTPGGLNSFSPPLRVPGGWTLRLYHINPHGTQALFFGVLLDTVDLYAYVPSHIDTIQRIAADNSMTLSVASPRPVNIDVQKTDDLLNWENIQAQVRRKETDTSKYVIEAPSTNALGFFRAQVRASN